jgi:hypothetical protein
VLVGTSLEVDKDCCDYDRGKRWSVSGEWGSGGKEEGKARMNREYGPGSH